VLQQYRSNSSPGPGVPRGLVYRPYPRCVCGNGSAYFTPGAMATSADFADQRQVALRVIDHYHRNGAALLAPLFVEPLAVIHGESGAGGSAADLGLDGYESWLFDIAEMPDAVRRFGADHFQIGDAFDYEFVLQQTQRPGVVLNAYSPECDPYSPLGSGALGCGQSSAPALFGAQVEVLERAFEAEGVPYVVESVQGAAAFADPARVTVLRAMDLGVHCEDAHCFQTPEGYRLPTDRALTERGRWLRAHSCPGAYAIFPKVDSFRCPAPVCCRIPLCQKVVCHGTQPPPGVSMSDVALKLGIDPAHTSSWRTMANMVPPSLARLVVAAMGHLVIHHALGLPLVTYDAAVVDPALIDWHCELTPLVARLAVVHRLKDLTPLINGVTEALLVLSRPGGVVTDAEGRLPAIDLHPGEWLQATAFDGLRHDTASMQQGLAPASLAMSSAVVPLLLCSPRASLPMICCVGWSPRTPPSTQAPARANAYSSLRSAVSMQHTATWRCGGRVIRAMSSSFELTQNARSETP